MEAYQIELDEKIMLGIVRISERFKKESSTMFQKEGLTFSQYSLLRILAIEPGGKMTMTEIGRRMLVSGANITGIAKRMERGGLITRKAAANDERIKHVEITAAGRRVVKQFNLETGRHSLGFLSAFSEVEKKELFRTLICIQKSASAEPE